MRLALPTILPLLILSACVEGVDPCPEGELLGSITCLCGEELVVRASDPAVCTCDEQGYTCEADTGIEADTLPDPAAAGR